MTSIVFMEEPCRIIVSIDRISHELWVEQSSSWQLEFGVGHGDFDGFGAWELIHGWLSNESPLLGPYCSTAPII